MGRSKTSRKKKNKTEFETTSVPRISSSPSQDVVGWQQSSKLPAPSTHPDMLLPSGKPLNEDGSISEVTDYGSKITKNDALGLFRLPPELRNAIYDLALPRDTCIVPYMRCLRLDALSRTLLEHELCKLCDMAGISMDSIVRKTAIPSLQQISQAVRYEALPMYYAYNKFILDLNNDGDRFGHSLAWLDSVDARGLASIVAMVVVGHTDCNTPRQPLWGQGHSPDSRVFAMQTTFSLTIRADYLSLGQTFVVQQLRVAKPGCGHEHPDRVERVTRLVREFEDTRIVECWDEKRYKAKVIALLRRTQYDDEVTPGRCLFLMFMVLSACVLSWGMPTFQERLMAAMRGD